MQFGGGVQKHARSKCVFRPYFVRASALCASQTAPLPREQTPREKKAPLSSGQLGAAQQALTFAVYGAPQVRDTITPQIKTKMQTLTIRIFLAASVLVAFAVGAVAQDKSTGIIKGKVKVEKGSAGGIDVLLLQQDNEISRTTTSKNGDFTLSRVQPGTYSVKFRKPGLAVGTVDGVTVKAGETRKLSDGLFLNIDEGSITFIRGSVFTENGRSVPGVRVDLARVIDDKSIQKLDSRITGETGEFVFRLPPNSARYRLTLRADGAETASKDVDVDGAAVYRIALTYKKPEK